METISNRGCTAMVYRVRRGFVCKMLRGLGSEKLIAEIDNAFAVERQLLERLGAHPRIVRYYGTYSIEGMKDGLLLGDANYGDLQSCIDGRDYGEIDDALRTKWSLQIAEAVAYIHEKGIIHSNLSTTNVLVHRTGQTTDLILADFGGSRCLELDLDGELLSDDPFMDPQLANLKLPKLDVFSLGVVIYIIMTDQYPFHQGPAPLAEERFIYGDRVLKLFDEGKFSTLSSVKFGSVIAGCYSERLFETTKEVVNVLEAEMRCHAS